MASENKIKTISCPPLFLPTYIYIYIYPRHLVQWPWTLLIRLSNTVSREILLLGLETGPNRRMALSRITCSSTISKKFTRPSDGLLTSRIGSHSENCCWPPREESLKLIKESAAPPPSISGWRILKIQIFPLPLFSTEKNSLLRNSGGQQFPRHLLLWKYLRKRGFLPPSLRKKRTSTITATTREPQDLFPLGKRPWTQSSQYRSLLRLP